MNQAEWIGLLKSDPEQAVKVLLHEEVKCAAAYRKTPAEFVYAVTPGHKSAKSNKLIARLDTGLREWFQQMRLQAVPVNVETYLFISRVWEAIHLLEYFDLPKTSALFLENEEDWLTWFESFPNMEFIRSPLQGYLKLIKQIKGKAK